MDFASSIERVYEHVENDRVEKAVLACLRIARAAQDHVNAAIFVRELYGTKHFKRVFVEDMRNLKPEAVKYVDDKSFQIWLAERTLPFNLDEDDDYKDVNEQRNVLALGIGDIESAITQLQGYIQDLTVPAGMAAFDTAAFTDSYSRRKAVFRMHIKANELVRNLVKARCFNYAVTVEKQLQAQQKPEMFLLEVQREVNNYFNARCDDVYTKLQKAAELADSASSEDHALLLTAVRRAMKAAADYFYPPPDNPVVCSDGKERKLGDDQYLNRLEEFIATSLPAGTSRDILKAELSFLAAFARRLNDISSKGVHADVTGGEAKQGLAGLYMFLYNVISRLQAREPSSDPTPAAQQA